ncbi:type I-C CRISPR-associated endonuclease Cas1c [Acetivibrio sp. MSJd-27]|jgi:CRISPR-associated protein Cas1|uniref:type I-C CRISPR-associated endonuclease Cas1c n=1 Tax=Acetivibrio sp. MSJd-27 TaxID=2841523 RepID=UPI001C123842|nr:type I-C CRISPR-associated endonuclease Cas1c [Acetivibrio sp. MSJd-27]MBU5449020.1 type I-C CRISPR-associated endonuclease Cas1c [Acetivibrio sp. MSJd-27]
MRQLLNILYVTTPDAYLSLDGENVVVSKKEETLGRIPLHNLQGIVAFGYVGASPALMGACVKRNIALTFLTMHGRFLARATGETNGNVLLRKEQYRASDKEEESLRYAKHFIKGKLFNARWSIERTKRDYAMRLDTEPLTKASSFLQNSFFLVDSCADPEQLRGVEGEAASVYFGVLDQMILQQKEFFCFQTRNRRPPTDPVNALLSFVYTLLAHDTASALETVGLDSYVGFLHRDRPGRISLALDLMEELRPVYADRFVLSLINKQQIKPAGFRKQENGAVMMEDETRKKILSLWQERKNETLTHPFLKQKISWGLVPYIQAQLLARSLRGDLDGYPPFLWK